MERRPDGCPSTHRPGYRRERHRSRGSTWNCLDRVVSGGGLEMFQNKVISDASNKQQTATPHRASGLSVET